MEPLLQALRDEIWNAGGPDRITFAPMKQDVVEMLQEHPGMVVRVWLNWRDDGLVELVVEDVNGR